MSFRFVTCAFWVLTPVMFMGCGGARHVAGGTPGTLHSGSLPLGDIQVTVHLVRDNTSEVIGMGITRADGRFELIQPGARGPMHLPPGEYRVTVESVGSVPLRFPKDYGTVEKSPLRVAWTADDSRLELEVPLPVAGR